MFTLAGLPIANWFGLIGSLCLLVPPARDQLRRFARARAAARQKRSLRHGRAALAEVWGSVKDGFSGRMERWSAADSACTGLGALLLALSYLYTPAT